MRYLYAPSSESNLVRGNDLTTSHCSALALSQRLMVDQFMAGEKNLDAGSVVME
jgi:hypothetical protein